MLIEFKGPYKKITMLDAIKEYTGFDIADMSEEEMRKVCDKTQYTTRPDYG